MEDQDYLGADLGKIQIADEVIQIIAGLAASEVPGVAGMSGSFAGGLTESLLGRRNLSKGVKVDFSDGEKTCRIDLSVVIDFGTNIPKICVDVQENVKDAVERMTGLDVASVHVHVVAIALESDKARDVAESTAERKNR